MNAIAPRSWRAEEQLLEVREDDDLVLQRGKVAGRHLSIGRFEKRREPPRTPRVGVVAEQHGADLVAQRGDRGPPLACLQRVQGREIGRASRGAADERAERIGVRAERQP